jgi:hypothetical protein
MDCLMLALILLFSLELQNRFYLSTDHSYFEVQDFGQFLDLAQLVPNAQCKVVCRPSLGPGLAELVGCHVAKAHAGVGVANL